VITQKIIHPNNIDKNFPNPSKYVSHVTILPSNITPSITRNTARAVQSLNKLSPSNISANFLGAQIDLNIDNTATGSVADINTQNKRQIINGISSPTNGNTKNNPNAIIIAEISRPNIASAHMVFQLLMICL
jgi:hypothetical protein